jgi:enoyl-CoA hydratase
MGRIEVGRLRGVGRVTLADPGRRNALDLETAGELAQAVAELELDTDVHAIVVTGLGSAFCAGADRRILASGDEAALRAVYASFLALRDCPLPTVAAVNGPAIGAGFNLALACDVRIAATSARFESRFLQLPIHPGGGHTWMLTRAVGPAAAMAMCVFDQTVDGPEAERIGLAWRCVADEELLPTCDAFCARLVDSPTPRLARSIKATMRSTAADVTFDAALDLELRKQIESMTTPEFAERIKGRQ